MPTTITTQEAIHIIQRNVNGTMAVSIDTNTEVDKSMRKTGNPFYGMGIRKLSTMNGLIGFDYENSVNNQALREGKETREAKPRKWGVLTDDRLFVVHNGKWYLQMKVQSATNVRYQYPNGNSIDVAVLEDFMPEKSRSSTQIDLTKEIFVRDITASNITAMRFKGAEYTIVPQDDVVMETEATPTVTNVTNATNVTNVTSAAQ